ncbi:Uncharacterised protein [Serratia quinivorans]|uniref:hypothetical protein n=1 Tax=Serratia quinivorans TaxID=137545 RepID=UPI000D8916AA|nr:hypothetical protein [Serratia quinivorans]SPZ62965.1 Uncharacterised protein [Serratia quinivorans]VEI62915.1 Uncharacterised protein [Serratia quinivorans]
MKINKKLTAFVLVIVVLIIGYVVWQCTKQDHVLECRARINTKFQEDKRETNSVFGVFLSMQGNGKGYWLISGTSSNSLSPKDWTDGIVYFTYKKEGGYFSIHMEKRDVRLIEMFDALTYDDLKLKIAKINNRNYALSLPHEMLLICTED